MISALECSLAGRTLEVEIKPASRTEACYGTRQVTESNYGSYGINPTWLARLQQAGLPIVATADDGTPRILELPDHLFFIATLFVPQARSKPGEPHPLIEGFVRAAAELGGEDAGHARP